MKPKKTLIPFSTLDGNMCSYTGCLPYSTADTARNKGRWIWKENYVFEDELKFKGFYRGCSSAGAKFISLKDGKEYNVFLKDLEQIITAKDLCSGVISGQFTFVKRGSNYGIRYLNRNTCGQCSHFTGAGDWDLCCTIAHPTPKEKERGLTFDFGHLCYESTEACDMFNSKEVK